MRRRRGSGVVLRGAERSLSLPAEHTGSHLHPVSCTLVCPASHGVLCHHHGDGDLMVQAAVTSVWWVSSSQAAQQVTLLSLFPRPAHDHYVPDLHHLKIELEEGTTPAGRAVRFGYNPLEFEGFSWRGYAQMSSIQVCLQAAAQPSSPWGGCGRWRTDVLLAHIFHPKCS